MAKAKSVKVKENETKAGGLNTPMENEAKPEGGAPDAGHADADKDKELITKMIADHIEGDAHKSLSEQEMEALHDLAKEAYQAHKEMGASDEDAYGHAGHALKLAHHMSKKKEKKEGDDMPDAEKKADPAAAKDDKKVPEDNETDKVENENEENDEKKVESARVKTLEKKLLEAEGRVAALEAKTKEGEVKEYVDQKLKESGQPVSVTKRFRDVAGNLKNKAEFDSKWSMFTEGLKNTRSTLDWSAMSEKAMAREDGARGDNSKGLDFSKCAD